MHHKILLKICGSILSLLLIMSCTTTLAFAESVKENSETSLVQIIDLPDGYKIVRETGILNEDNRSAAITKYRKESLRDANNVEQCAFYLYGEFITNTQKCVNSYFSTTTSGGQWRVENPSQHHDTYTAYGSFTFVRRVLGINIGEKPMNVSLNYNS